MEENTTPQTPDPIESNIEPTPPHHKSMLVYMVMGLVIFALGYGGGYYLGQKSSSVKATEVSQITPSTIPSTISQKPVEKVMEVSVDASMADWDIYQNKEYGFQFKNPGGLYLKENGPSWIKLEQNPIDIDEVFSINYFLVQVDSMYAYSFPALIQAKPGEDVIEAQNAVGVVIEKIRNLSVDGYEAVEYIRDGITQYDPDRDGGRGFIGYEHNILIKVDEQTYIRLTNSNKAKDQTEALDPIFNQILSTFEFVE